MRLSSKLITAGALLMAGTAWAHEDVGGVVGERMKLMEGIRDDIKIIGSMAKGEMAYDAARSQAAFAGIAEKARQIPASFETEEMHHKSEAKPDIWTNWDDFVTRSDALVTAASGASAAGDLDALKGGLGRIGKSCQGCHEKYRIKKEE